MVNHKMINIPFENLKFANFTHKVLQQTTKIMDYKRIYFFVNIFFQDSNGKHHRI